MASDVCRANLCVFTQTATFPPPQRSLLWAGILSVDQPALYVKAWLQIQPGAGLHQIWSESQPTAVYKSIIHPRPSWRQDSIGAGPKSTAPPLGDNYPLEAATTSQALEVS